MKILITGPQGCGKTTQAKLLSQKLGFCLIDAGDLLREFALKGGEEGKSVKDDLEIGNLVDDKLIASLVASKISASECQNGYVAAGYPRNLASLENFDPEFDKVFYLNISDQEAEKRLLHRGREDDTPTTIRDRLRVYHQYTTPVLNHYQTLGKLIKIDGEQSIEDIANQIESKVREGK